MKTDLEYLPAARVRGYRLEVETGESALLVAVRRHLGARRAVRVSEAALLREKLTRRSDIERLQEAWLDACREERDAEEALHRVVDLLDQRASPADPDGVYADEGGL